MLKRLFLFLALVGVLASSEAFAATFSVAAWTNSTLSAASASASTGTGVISRGSGITNSATTNYFNSASWDSNTDAASALSNGDYVQITVDTTNYKNISLSFASYRSSTGPQNVQPYYSTTGTGGTFVALGSALTINSSTTNYTLDLSSVTDANNNANLVIRLAGYNVGTGGASSGTLRFYNIAVTATAPSFSGDFTFLPATLTLSNVDATLDSVAARTASVTVFTGSNSVTFDSVSVTSGSTAWSLATALPLTVSANSTATLSFLFAPSANTGSTTATTFAIGASGNSPASMSLTAVGTTVLEKTLSAFKADAEAGLTAGRVYKVSGVVSANTISTTTYQLFLQDRTDGDSATRGVNIYDTSKVGYGAGPLPAVGQTVVAYGTYANNRGLVEIVPIRAYVNQGGSATITPVLVPLANLNNSSSPLGDQYEGVLVAVRATDNHEGLAFSAATMASAGSYIASDQTGTTGTLYVNATTKVAGYVLSAPPANFYNVNGIISQYSSSGSPNSGGDTYEIIPRSQADIILNSTPVELSNFSAE